MRIPCIHLEWSCRIIVGLLASATAWTQGLPTREFRALTNTAGVAIEAAVVGVEDGQVTLIRKRDGKQFTASVTLFQESDRKWLESWKPPLPPGVRPAPDQDISSVIEPNLHARMPSLAVAVISGGELLATGIQGVRIAGKPEPATIRDKYHVGSCTKPMTATLVATFVEEGKLAWDTTIKDILEDHDMNPAYEGVTLAQLLSHTGGFPKDVPDAIWSQAWADWRKGRLSPSEQRENFVTALLVEEPSSPPGSAFEYSNAGYTVAGFLLEELSGKSWESLMRERLFGPLEMSSAGFGGAATSDDPDQPWAHRFIDEPVEPGVGDDNPPAIGPAGIVHCNLLDMAAFVRMHLLTETGPVLKQKDTYTRLHEVVKNTYTLGWVKVRRPWGDGFVYTHTGSNTMNFMMVWFAPETGFAAIVATNTGEDAMSPHLDQTVAKLIDWEKEQR